MSTARVIRYCAVRTIKTAPTIPMLFPSIAVTWSQFDALRVALADHRPHFRSLGKLVARGQRFDARFEGIEEIAVNLVRRQDPLGRDANLTGVRVARNGHHRRRFVEIGGLAFLIGLGTPLLSVEAARPQMPDLEAGFRNVPEADRPWVYWWWLNGHVDERTITRDLEAMKAAGFGGLLMFDARGYHDDQNHVVMPPPKMEFMSPEWRSLFKHAVLEAERLGLEITLNAGPGWTGSGGPWVKPEQSMQHIVASETTAAGPARFALRDAYDERHTIVTIVRKQIERAAEGFLQIPMRG